MITEGIAENAMTGDDHQNLAIRNNSKLRNMETLVPEIFGGIEFIRICSLSESQKKKFWRSPTSKKVIMILRDKELLSDCIYYKDYCDFEISNLAST